MTRQHPGDVLFYNFHPPEEVRVFAAPQRSIKLWDSSVFVFDVRVGDGILRNYAFTDQWFEVHCTFDLSGELLPESGPIEWVFNCDMCTPMVVQDHAIFNVDLSLDVLVAPDGATYMLTDEPEFARAAAAGWLTETEVVGARQGAEELISIIRSTGLRPFLESILPFDSVLDNEPQGPPAITSPAQVPYFSMAERERLWNAAMLRRHGSSGDG